MKYVRGFVGQWKAMGEEWCSVRERLALSHEAGVEAARDWEAHERAVLMCAGKLQPSSRRERRLFHKMDRYLDRRAWELARGKTELELWSLSGHRRSRLDSFIGLSDQLGKHAMPTVAKNRELVEIVERACTIKRMAKMQGELSV